MDETDMLWNVSEEDENAECEEDEDKMKALTVKMKTITMIGRGS
jgi:hypothetical protein